MKVALKIGNENFILECRQAICLSCAKCDLEEWERNHFKNGASPTACKGLSVCSPDKIACTEFEPRK